MKFSGHIPSILLDRQVTAEYSGRLHFVMTSVTMADSLLTKWGLL